MANAQTISKNKTGMHNGFYYSFWSDGTSGTASITLQPKGRYTTQWTNVGNFTAGKGWAKGKADRKICFTGKFNGGSNGYLAIYGWTKDSLIEYYVVENYGDWTPPGARSLGTFNSDGGTYNIYKTQRVEQPSIVGTATFYQYWSVRTTKRSSGTVTFANHVAAWKAKGMRLGKIWDYQIVETEGYQSSGSSDISVSECR
ncbi:MAG TPA: glycoside hydrolase family 11 protein [Phnomibacter sp.]|nr:glycoside hydrolase family 11 protein [Phnomibacter sp.]